MIPESELILNKDGTVYHLNLGPKDIADTIIAVGDPGRVHSVSQYFDTLDFEMNKREFITHTGKYKGQRLTVLSTGMGTDNIEIVMTELDALVNIDLKKREPKARKKKLNIIRVGTSGSLQEDLRLGSHLASDYAVGLDNLMSFYELQQTDYELLLGQDIMQKTGLPFTPYVVQASQKLLQHFGEDMVKGNTLTCPGFYAPQGREVRLKPRIKDLIKNLNYYHHDDFWLTNFEMETAGYYAMGRMLGHEMLSLNAIIANRIRHKFSKNPGKVIDSLIRKVLDRAVTLT